MNTGFDNSLLNHDHVSVVEFDEDVLEKLAVTLIERHATQLPDLTTVTILLSNIDAAFSLRKHLTCAAVKVGCEALLGPPIESLKSWVYKKSSPLDNSVSNYARQLILVEALRSHPQLYGKGSPWVLSDSLLELFDELTLWNVALPQSLDDFYLKLKRAYNIKEQQISALGYEANLVHTLWYALHEQLQAQSLIDRNSQYLLSLSQALKRFTPEETLYFAGSLPQLPAEHRLLQSLLATGRLHVFTTAQAPTLDVDSANGNGTTVFVHGATSAAQNNYTSLNFLRSCYDVSNQGLLSRALNFAAHHPTSPVQQSISIYKASNTEDEVNAIDIQVRRWLIDGRQRIGIVTENRKLARRLRAVLERAGIELNDQSGWALSTTSAATLVERWLQTVEENFHYLALLDVLKSPFFSRENDHDTHLNKVYRFEQSIVLQENISHGIERYLSHVNYRKKRLTQELQHYYDGIEELLNLLASAARPLQECLHAGEINPTVFLDALLESLQLLPLLEGLQKDAAGMRILQEINAMRAASPLCAIKMDWMTFRTWLGSNLEKFNFKLPVRTQRVKLLTLAQTDMQQLDGLIFASAEHRYLPHLQRRSPFFNDAVRAELGLPTLKSARAEQFGNYFRLLARLSKPDSSSPSILFTLRNKEGDEEIIPSPWVQTLQAFHTLAYADDLNDIELAQLVILNAGHIDVDSLALPSPLTDITQTAIPENLVPKVFSASAYQQLMDCPYQFFAARCLQLTPPDAIRTMLAKSDYGERVHLCLQAFHSNVPHLPGPFAHPVAESNRKDAINTLEQISEVVFAKDIENNLLHRGWLKRWLQQIPFYIDWQIQQAKDWTTAHLEINVQDAVLNTPGGVIQLNGRIDRIDRDKEGFYIIDYKTGQTADLSEIQDGEAVQLPFYSLLAAHSSALQNQLGKPFKRVAYVKVNDAKVNDRIGLDDTDIHDLSEQIGLRLEQTHNLMRQHQPLPAWGDNQVCAYCVMEGLCRREMLQTTFGETTLSTE